MALQKAQVGSKPRNVCTFWRDTPLEEKVHVPYHDDWPKLPVVEGEPVKLGQHVRATLLEAMQCASEESSRQVLNGVYLDVEDQQADSGSMAKGTMDTKGDPSKFRVPRLATLWVLSMTRSARLRRGSCVKRHP